jgi:hypothetical protein
MFCINAEGYKILAQQEAIKKAEQAKQEKEAKEFAEYKGTVFKEVEKDSANIELKDVKKPEVKK